MKNSNSTTALILAAGEGTRMKSDMAKVLHKICGKPMVHYVIDSVREAGVSRILVVIGYRAETVEDELEIEGVEFVLQRERLGTAHAVLAAREKLKSFDGTLIVLTGDTPLLESSTLRNLVNFHEDQNASATVLTAVLGDATGYGRIIRDEQQRFVEIVEHDDADEKAKKVREINSGIFCFDCQKLFSVLGEVKRDNIQGEYYLTDIVSIFMGRSWTVETFIVENSVQVVGVNNLEQLQYVERMMKDNG
jgi:bifunctional UDP-N-acetylglucosamine pyrophosphorylase/glucosamine-1-phosphate N-acetyltransferase